MENVDMIDIYIQVFILSTNTINSIDKLGKKATTNLS